MDWHQRYLQQAKWTYPLRQYIYRQVKLQDARKVLDVGCGTGALLQELYETSSAEVFGLDIDSQALSQASKHCNSAFLTQADAHKLPFPRDCFDTVLCHFVLLWTKDPAAVIAEMKRVTRPNGAIVALAEPDYPGRIDFPTGLEVIGRLQTTALERQGADPALGRRLAGLFSKNGLVDLEVGVLGGHWKLPVPKQELDLEWDILRSDLEELLSPTELVEFHFMDAEARQSGERILYVPTFYACGRKPG